MIFAAFDVLLHVAVNVCINCSFVHLYLLFYYSLRHFSWFGPYYFSSFQVVFVGYVRPICFFFDNLRYVSICTMYHLSCIILLCCISLLLLLLLLLVFCCSQQVNDSHHLAAGNRR